MVASSRTVPPAAWLTVQISKPSLLPRISRLCWRVSREVPARITDVCAKTHEPRLGYGPTSGAIVGMVIESW